MPPKRGGGRRPEAEAEGRADKGHGARGLTRVPAGTLARATKRLLSLVDRGIDCAASAFHVGMRLLGPLLVCLALSLIGFVTYTFLVHALPLMEAGATRRGALTATGVFLLSNALYNYVRAVCTDAGCPPEYDEVQAELRLEAEELGTAAPRRCVQCARLKPARAHHCRTCGRCVLKMDHHCPWINNCAGHGNYRHFCLFMLFLLLSCLFVAVTFHSHFSPIFPLHLARRSKSPILRASRWGRQCILFSFMICGSVCIALLLLGGFHLYLVLSNQTTIEFQTGGTRRAEARKNGEGWRNPYDLGRSRNFQQVFGPNAFFRFLWLFPYLGQPPTGNGLTFPSVSRFRV